MVKSHIMFNISLGHIIILVFVVMLFGPKRVSQLGATLGRSLKGVKDSLDGVKQSTGFHHFDAAKSNLRDEVNKFKDGINPLKANGPAESKNNDGGANKPPLA